MSGKTFLPRDGNGFPMQILRFRDSLSHQITTSGTTSRNGTDFGNQTQVLLLNPTQDMFIKQGGSSVVATATDHFLAAGQPYYVSTRDLKRIAAIQDSAAGILHISELE